MLPIGAILDIGSKVLDKVFPDPAAGEAAKAKIGTPASIATATTPALFPPTVLVDVPYDARAMREETFGPLMVIAKVASADEAVARANASDFGLSGSVWSRDSARAAAIAARQPRILAVIARTIATACATNRAQL